MDIGTLTGAVEIEDQASAALNAIASQVERFTSGWEGAMGSIVTAAGIGVAAIGAVTGAITALGMKGSTILGVEESFDRLARAAGTTGEALITGLSKGVRNTVDSMELMRATTRLLDSGVKVSAQSFETMGALARELGKATGTTATQGLNQLSQALLTGNTRSVRRLGIQVDLVSAEKKFREQIGGTTAALNEAGKLEVKRIALMDGMKTRLDSLGVSELSFKERIQQSTVAIGNWFDDLAKAVAKSPVVLQALDNITDAFKNGSSTSIPRSMKD